MIYADTTDGRYVQGTAGILDWAKTALTTVGLRDPINSYEPGKPLPEVFSKYSASLYQSQREISAIRQGSVRDALSRQLAPLLSLRDRLSVAFAPGAVAGKSDRDDLNTIVQGARNLVRDVRAAKKKYGAGAPVVMTTTSMPVRPPANGMPGWVLPVGVAAALAFFAFR
jgi:hypothetical protein